MSTTIATLHDLFVHELMDLYSAENQIIKALPKMIEVAKDDTLKEGFEKHLEETQEQRSRIEQVCNDLEIPLKSHECKGMKGIILEGEEMMKSTNGAVDAALIIAAQRVEHYEIAGYGAAVTHAKELGYTDAAEMLAKTLDEEEKTDKKLSTLAEKKINKEAMEG